MRGRRRWRLPATEAARPATAMASPAGDDPAPSPSASLPCVSRGGPPPPAPVHQPRPTHSTCAACAASDAPCGPPPTYDEAMGFSTTPGPILNWAQSFRDQPPAYHPAPNISEGRIPAADLCEIFDLLQSSSRTSNSESLPSEDRAKPSSRALNASTSGAPLCVDISDTEWNIVLGHGSADASAPLPPPPPVTVQPRPQARRPPARPAARLASGGGGGGAEGEDEHAWGPYAVRTLCPRCQRVVCTDIVVEDAEYTHVCALGLCLMGCWPFCLVPYCLDACRRVTHSCPRCHMLLGAYSPHSPHSPRHPRNRARPRPRTRARARARSTACR